MDQTSLFVHAAVDGDRDGVAWLVERFTPFLQAQIRLRLGSRGTEQDVEDLTADTWLVALSRVGDLEPRAGRLAPVLVRFLGATALNHCNNLLRRRIREQGGRARAPEPRSAELSQIEAETLGVVTRAAQRDLHEIVRRSVDRLSADKRDVLVLRLMEHRTNAEIAEILGLQPNTVAVRYRRALDELRRDLPDSLFAELWGTRDGPCATTPG